MKLISIPVLTAVLLISSCNYFFPRLTGDKISVNEAFGFLQKHSGEPDVVVIDVRSKAEYDLGHIQNAVLIDYNMTSFPDEIGKLDRDKTYIVYDKTGAKSSNTFELMKELRFKDVHVITGGFDAWNAENLPLVR